MSPLKNKQTRMLKKKKKVTLWKKTFTNNDTFLNAHTLHLIYVNALDFSQNKKRSSRF